jgi:hypothetical protein
MGTGEVAGDNAVEKPKMQKQASKGKKGQLREQIQCAVKPSSLPMAKQGKEKRTAPEEEV